MATLRSHFFKSHHISEYKNQLKPTLAERNLTVLNLEELLQYLNQTRLDIAYDLRKSARRELQKTKEREQNMASIIHNLAAMMCTDIGKLYGKQAIERTVKAANTGGESKFDILVLIDANYEILDLKSKRPLMDQRFDKIHGFLVTELGECKSQPAVHSVNLICANVSGGGAVLMGAYLYCIKRTPELPQLGLLELAGGYKNTTGLCAYSKFGYIANLVYLGPHCFGDPGNLPMSVDVGRLTEEQIFAVVRGTAKVTQFDPTVRETTIFDMLYTHPLCNRALFVDDFEQEDLALKYNRLYRLMYDVRTLSGYEANALEIPNEVYNMIKRTLQEKVDYYEDKKHRTGKYLSVEQKSDVVRQVVDSKINQKIAALTDLVNEIQEEKQALLERKKRKLEREAERSHDADKKRAIFEQIRVLDSQIAAINRFRGEDAPSPESVRSATTILATPSTSPSIMSEVSEEDVEAEKKHMYMTKAKAKAMYLKKKSAKKAARATAKKLAEKKERAAKKTTRRMPPKVPRVAAIPVSDNGK